MVYNRVMVKIFVCDKNGSLETVLEELKRSFSDICINFIPNCQEGPFIGIAGDGVDEPQVLFYGNPKFDALIHSVEIYQKGSFQISDRVVDFIGMIDKEVNIKVFITNSCGWCFPAIIKAVSFAYLSQKIKVEVFDCYSFPQYANRYNVITVPKTVINDKVEFIGGKDDNEFLGYIIKSIED